MNVSLEDNIFERTHKSLCRWLEHSDAALGQWIRQFWVIFFILMLIQIAAYSYFYTTLIFTNHTFPNVWVQQYPSYRTWGEGRWLADLIFLFQGDSGVQSFQMISATMLQALNGILLARFLELKSKLATLCVAAILCMYPAFLDYYSFSSDHFIFVLGDTFALLGAQNLVKGRTFWGRIRGSAPFFLLAIACYQPKVALVGFLASSAVLLRFTKASETEYEVSPTRETCLDAISMVVAVAAALCIYWLTTKILVVVDIGMRTHLNTPSEAISEILASYQKTFAYFTKGSAGIPPKLQFLPGVGIVLGVFVVLLEAWRKHVFVFVMAIVILTLIPISLHASYVINNQSWQNTGRIVAASGYCLIFFLGYGFRMKVIRVASATIATICLYFFIILAVQESNAAALKTMYDLNFINRITTRAEWVLGTLNGPKWALVITGRYPAFDRHQYVKYPDGQSAAHVSSYPFEMYRQEEILNFFLGKNVFRRPTKSEVNRVLESMQDKKPWPSDESVYLLDDVLVIILETYRPDIPVTWTSD